MLSNSNHISNRIFRSQRFMIIIILSSFIGLLIVTSISGHGAALHEQVASASDRLAIYASTMKKFSSGKSDAQMEKEAEEEELLKQSAAAEKENGKSKEPESGKADDDEDEDEEFKDSDIKEAHVNDTKLKDTDEEIPAEAEEISEKGTDKASQEVVEDESDVVEGTAITPKISNSGPADPLEEGEDTGEDTEVKLQQDDDIAATPPKEFSPDEDSEAVIEGEEVASEYLDATVS